MNIKLIIDRTLCSHHLFSRINKKIIKNPLTFFSRCDIMFLPLCGRAFFRARSAILGHESARREVHTVHTAAMVTISRENKSVLQEVPTNMANDVRVRVTLVCSECKQRNYDTKKNKKHDPDRIELKKYCRFCRKHTVHKESK